jgi:hypothetical protein
MQAKTPAPQRRISLWSRPLACQISFSVACQVLGAAKTSGEFEFESVAPGCDAALSPLRPPHGEVGTKIGK